MGFTMDTGGLRRKLDEMSQRRLYAMETYSYSAAAQLEKDAVASAPWRDRTGHARQGIRGRASRNGSIFTVTLSGSVHYMVYLELANGRKWAALWPTMQRDMQRVLTGFARAGGYV